MMRYCFRYWWVSLLVLVTLLGCGKKDYLPQPRAAVDEEEEEAAVARRPAAPAPSAPGAASTEAREAPPNGAPAQPTASAQPVDSPGELSAMDLANRALLNRPAQPLSSEQRRKRTIDNLNQIGKAVAYFMDRRKTFPTPFTSQDGAPLLSWRVRLLPFMGAEELYDAFRLNEPWDSPHNRKLLARIPPAYQSPERFDARTNYLMLQGDGLVLQQAAGVSADQVHDGLTKTLAVVEVDDSRAVPWTKPEELTVDLTAPRQGLGDLREDGFFALLSDGRPCLISARASDEALGALFTIDGREPPNFVEFILGPSVVVRAEARKSTPETATVASQATPTVAIQATPTKQLADHELRRAKTGVASKPKSPIPDEASQAAARATLREMYSPKFEKAKTPRERLTVAQEMFNTVPRLGDDDAGRYVLLRAIGEIAADSSSVDLARKALDELAEHFVLDVAEVALEVIRKLAPSLTEKAERRDLAEWANAMCDQAYATDNYTAARELYHVSLNLARSTEDRELMREIMTRGASIEDARREYAQVARMIAMMDESPDDPQANLVVGRYLCFVKGQWERGLPLLAKSGDRHLADLGMWELAFPASPESQMELADGWWNLAEGQNDAQKRVLQERAAYWYRQALANLPEGLSKLKAEMRLKEAGGRAGERG